MTRRPKCWHCGRWADGIAEYRWPTRKQPVCARCALLFGKEVDVLCRLECVVASEHPVYRPGFYHCREPMPYPEDNGSEQARQWEASVR